MIIIGDKVFLDTSEMIWLTGTYKQLLKAWRKEGMPYIKIKKSWSKKCCYYYPYPEVRDWLKSHKGIDIDKILKEVGRAVCYN